MQYIQVIAAADVMSARDRYFDLLQRQGVVVDPSADVVVETIHRPDPNARMDWLCYIALARDLAA